MYGVREAEDTFCEPNTDISCIWMSSLSNGFGRFDEFFCLALRDRWLELGGGRLVVQQAVNLNSTMDFAGLKVETNGMKIILKNQNKINLL